MLLLSRKAQHLHHITDLDESMIIIFTEEVDIAGRNVVGLNEFETLPLCYFGKKA